MSGFRTKLDFSDNRQAKQRPITRTVLSGGTSFGLPYNLLPSGPNLATSAITGNYTYIASTFSGDNTTTIYNWSDPRMQLGVSSLSALTSSTSGLTQNTGAVWTANTTTVIDGNTVALTYSGVNFDISVVTIAQLTPSTYSGTITTNNFDVYTASTLDYTGRTIWVDVSGITRTEKLIISKNPQVGYVWTCIDSEGMGEWQYNGSSSGTTIWTAGTGVNSAVLGGSNGIASGSTSVSEGVNTKAGGIASHAEGGGTQALGDLSHAEGEDTIASNTAAHAEGVNTVASGVYSHAEGSNTIASNARSHAEGYLSIASGVVSHAEGESTLASGDNSHAEGSSTIASGINSHAEGFTTIASGNTSHAEGNYTIAGGFYSHAEGSGTTAIGSSSHAEGDITIASGTTSHAEGYQTQANGYASHAEGGNTLANGDYSHAEGFGDTYGITTASGFASHAEGYATLASGDASHSQGFRTQANGEYSHAGGNQSIVKSDYGFIHSTLSTIETGSTYSSILGGYNNLIDSGEYSSIIGGKVNNLNTSNYSIIAGGSGNTITKNTDNLTQAKYSGIFAGANNTIIPRFGGLSDLMSGSYSVIAGGYGNTVSGHSYSFIGGGNNNLISCDAGYNAIIGGSDNVNHAAHGVIIGGYGHILDANILCPATSDNSVIVGGNFNYIGSAENTVILGGYSISGTSSNTVYVPNMIINTGGTASKLGINTSAPEYIIDANGNNARLILADTYTGADAPFKSFVFSADSTNVPQIVASTSYTGGLGLALAMGVVGNNSISTASSELVGLSGDTYINSTQQTNNLNILNRSGGVGTTNNIRMYAGVNSVSAASEPDFIIRGSGSTRGFVGFNTGSPTERLHIVSTLSSKIRLDADINNTDETATAQLLMTQDGGGSTANIGLTPDTNNDLIIGVNSGGGTTPDIRFNTRSDGTVFTTTADTKMILKNDGKLGINIDSPDYLIDAMGTGNRFYYSSAGVGNITISATTGLPSVGVVAGTANASNQLASISMGARAWDDSIYTVYGYQGDAFIYAGIYTNGLNIISNDGSTSGTGADYIRFYAGQSTGAGASNNPDLHIQGSGSTRGFVAINVPHNQDPTQRLDVNGNARFRGVGSAASTGALHYTSDGTLTTNTSDERLKTNIVTLTNALEKVKQLRGVKYNWTEEPNGDLRIGLIAQEVNSVVPELTFVNKNTEELYMGVHYDNVVALLIEAVKELSSGVTTSNNSHLETQTILAEDNNIELNFNGTQETSLGGGLSVLHAKGQDQSAELITDENGDFVTNNDFKPNALTIPLYTPSSSNDAAGNEGNITRDDNYMYVKTSTGWKRTNLENF